MEKRKYEKFPNEKMENFRMKNEKFLNEKMENS